MMGIRPDNFGQVDEQIQRVTVKGDLEILEGATKQVHFRCVVRVDYWVDSINYLGR